MSHKGTHVSKVYQVSSDLFSDQVINSESLRDLARKLGYTNYASGAVIKSIRKRILEMGLDMSHFKGQGHLKGKTHNWSTGMSDDIVFQENSPYLSGGHGLKKKMLKR